VHHREVVGRHRHHHELLRAEAFVDVGGTRKLGAVDARENVEHGRAQDAARLVRLPVEDGDVIQETEVALERIHERVKLSLVHLRRRKGVVRTFFVDRELFRRERSVVRRFTAEDLEPLSDAVVGVGALPAHLDEGEELDRLRACSGPVGARAARVDRRPCHLHIAEHDAAHLAPGTLELQRNFESHDAPERVPAHVHRALGLVLFDGADEARCELRERGALARLVAEVEAAHLERRGFGEVGEPIAGDVAIDAGAHVERRTGFGAVHLQGWDVVRS